MDRFEPLGIGAGTLVDGRYDIVSRLGAGGMSIVFEARDRALNNDRLALKLFSPALTDNPSQLARFRNEGSITRKLTHPNIIRTYEFGSINKGQYYYITMEYIEGKTLEHSIYNSEYALPFAATLRILYEVTKGVAYAHSMGVVHRDLKPANILMSDAGEVKVADFGLAQNENLDERLTKAGECVGTPSYMAPEQIQELPCDHRVDLYSIGILGYELAVGKVPFQKSTWFELARQIISEPLPDFGPKKNKVPVWFQEMIRKATAKRKEDRFSSAEEMLAIIEPHLTEAPVGASLLEFGRRTTRLELASARRSSYRRFSNTTVVSAVMIIAIVLTGLTLSLFEAGGKAVEEVSTNLSGSKSTINDFVDTVVKMRELVVETVKAKPIIDERYEQEKEKLSEESHLGAPLQAPEATLPMTPVPVSTSDQP